MVGGWLHMTVLLPPNSADGREWMQVTPVATRDPDHV